MNLIYALLIVAVLAAVFMAGVFWGRKHPKEADKLANAATDVRDKAKDAINKAKK